MKLIPTTEDNTHFSAQGIQSTFSVVDVGKMMESAALRIYKDKDYYRNNPVGMFLGWEAARMDALTKELSFGDDDMFRADSWDELNKILDENDI